MGYFRDKYGSPTPRTAPTPPPEALPPAGGFTGLGKELLNQAKEETSGGFLSGFTFPLRFATEVGQDILRALPELVAEVARDPRKKAKPIPIENPVMRTVMGTDAIIPPSVEGEALTKEYGAPAGTTAFALHKIGQTVPAAAAISDVLPRVASKTVPKAVSKSVGKTAQKTTASLPAELRPAVSKTSTKASSTAAASVDDLINVGKFGLDQTGEARLRQSVKSLGVEKRTVTWEETQKIADQIGLDPSRVIRKKAEKLDGSELKAIRDIVSSNIEYIASTEKRLLNPAVPQGAREALESGVERAARQNEALLEKFIKARSQKGRDLNTLKMIANRDLDPTLWVVQAKRALGDKPLTEDIVLRVTELAKAKDRGGLADYIGSLVQSSSAEKGITLWKAGLLTSPTTDLANIFGNFLFGAAEIAKDVPATLLDAIASKITGTRTKAFTLPSRGATVEGLREAGRYIRTGIDEAELLQKFDVPKRVNFDNPVLKAYTDVVFRKLGAEDIVPRRIALDRSLREQAKVIATSEGLHGETAATRIKNLLDNPSPGMLAEATDAAEKATFRNLNALAQGISGAKRSIGERSPTGKTALEVLAPFTTTPTNIAAAILEYSPYGFLQTAIKMAKPANRAQKIVVESLGRNITGSAVVSLGYMLGSQGIVTGNYPDDSGERNAWREANIRPNSILVNGEWRRLERFAPIGNLLAMGAQFHQFEEAGKSPFGAFVSGAPATIKQLTEQTFLRGVSGGLKAITEPDRYGEAFLEQTAASVIPSIVGRTATALDPTRRVIDDPLDALLNRLPGLRSTLEPSVSALGETEEYKGGPAALIDPFSSAKERKTEAAQYLKELGWAPPPHRGEIEGLELSGEQKTILKKAVGNARLLVVNALLADPLFRGLPRDIQVTGVQNRTSAITTEIVRVFRDLWSAHEAP